MGKPKTTGVFEWATESRNFQQGCEHGCRYCYAQANIVKRFGTCTAEQWLCPVINHKKVNAPHSKYVRGGVMMPSTHDITPRNIMEYLCVLRKELAVGNNVLIVSKPHLVCIQLICDACFDYKDQIKFRFTIGATDDKILQFWEPGAPCFEERLNCLIYAYRAGFKTSVSCEPYLDYYPEYVYMACEQWVNDSIWFGLMRSMKYRVATDAMGAAEIINYVLPLTSAYSDSFVLGKVDLMGGWALTEWKDSVKAVIKKHAKEGIQNAKRPT